MDGGGTMTAAGGTAADDSTAVAASSSSSSVVAAAAAAAAAADGNDATVAAASIASPSGHASKRIRRSFAELAAHDSITLPLVFSFLDVYSLLKGRRVCRSWSSSSRRAVAWQHCTFAINLEYLLSIPSSSVTMLRHLTVVRDLKSPLPPLQPIFQWLSALPMLASLRLEELEVNTQLCDLLANYLPTLRKLDIKMAIVNEKRINPRERKLQHALQHRLMHTHPDQPAYAQVQAAAAHMPVAPESDSDDENASDGDEEEEEAAMSENKMEEWEESKVAELLPGSVNGMALSAEAASQTVGPVPFKPEQVAAAARFMFNLPHWPPQVGDDLDVPTLVLPSLQALKLPNSKSLCHTLAMVAHAPSLMTLHIRRVNTAASALDSPTGERAFILLFNALFHTSYAHSLQHLLLTNMHWHPFGSLDFAALHALTHLSLVQSNATHAISVHTLQAIARLAKLQQVEIRVGQGSCEVCVDPEWWTALASIRALVGFGFNNPAGAATFNDQQLAIIRNGMDQVTASAHCRLTTVQLADDAVFNDSTLRLLTRVPTIHSLSIHSLKQMSIECFTDLAAGLPNLTSFEVVHSPLLHSSDGLRTICRLMPGLRSLSYRLPSSRLMAGHGSALFPTGTTVSDDAWLQLAHMPHLTFLHLSGYGQLPDTVVNGWCQQAIDGGRRQMTMHLAKLKRFAGFDAGFDFSNHSDSASAIAPADAGASAAPAAASAAAAASSSPSSSSSLVSTSASSMFNSSESALSGVPWQEIRLSGWMLSYEQSGRLLRSLPQLQLLSVHLLPSSSGSFTSPNHFRSRLLFAGGDYMQRQIATYITRTCTTQIRHMHSGYGQWARSQCRWNCHLFFFSRTFFICVISALHVLAFALFRSR